MSDPDLALFAAFQALPLDEPIEIMALLRFHERADYPAGHADASAGASGEAAYDRFRQAIAAVYEDAGVFEVWCGAAELVLAGNAGQRWDRASINWFPDAVTFVRLLTDPVVREAMVHRQAAVADSHLIRFRRPGRAEPATPA